MRVAQSTLETVLQPILRSVLIAGGLIVGLISSAEAKSCSDVLATCLKMYSVVRGHQGPSDPATTCRNDYNGCMSTGTWAGTTTVIKGLEKK